jgi:hypothetical protein
MKNIYFYLLLGVFLYIVINRFIENYIQQENFDPSLVPVSSIVTLAKVAQKLVNGNGTLTNPGSLQIGASTATPGNLTVTGNSDVNGDIAAKGSVVFGGKTATGFKLTNENNNGWACLRAGDGTSGSIEGNRLCFNKGYGIANFNPNGSLQLAGGLIVPGVTTTNGLISSNEITTNSLVSSGKITTKDFVSKGEILLQGLLQNDGSVSDTINVGGTGGGGPNPCSLNVRGKLTVGYGDALDHTGAEILGDLNVKAGTIGNTKYGNLTVGGAISGATFNGLSFVKGVANVGGNQALNVCWLPKGLYLMSGMISGDQTYRTVTLIAFDGNGITFTNINAYTNTYFFNQGISADKSSVNLGWGFCPYIGTTFSWSYHQLA